MTSTITLDGVVLAGGKSTRMGCDKAFLPAGGVSLLQRQLNLLRSVGCQHIFISGRRDTDYSTFDATTLHDAVDDAGPLAGIAAALHASTASHVLVLAVDLLSMNKHFLSRLISHCQPSHGAVPRQPRGWEPLAAVYPVHVRDALFRRLETGRFGVQELVEETMSQGHIVPMMVTTADLPLVTNANHPSDLRLIPDRF
jgi:molybdopterin-guanine dinucleotide biosynthesis protein A